MAPPPQPQHMLADEKSASSNWPQNTGFSVYVEQSAEKKSRAPAFVSEHTAGGDGGAIGGDGGMTPPPQPQHMVLAVKSGSSSTPHH